MRLSLLLPVLLVALVLACDGEEETTDISQPTPSPPQVSPIPPLAFTTPVAPSTPVERPMGVFVVNADGSGLRQVWDGDAVGHSWSPDGRFIAFADRLAPTHDVMLLDVETGAVRNLGPSSPSAVKWSPDGRSLLVVVSDEDPTRRFLETIDVTTGERKRLTGGIFGEWSPDGRRISFSGPSCERYQDRRTYDLETAEVTDLTPEYPEARVFVSPDWSHIAYFKGHPPAAQTAVEAYTLYVADLDGSDERALPSGLLGPGWPIWSPDGKWLSYTVTTASGGPKGERPYLIRSDGGGLPAPVADRGRASGWSPDSARVVVDDGDGVFLHDVRDGSRIPVWDTRAGHIEWSADGSRLAFTAAAPGEDRADLYVYDVATQAVRKLTDASIYAAGPKWSPDGRRIAFLDIPGGYDYGPCL